MSEFRVSLVKPPFVIPFVSVFGHRGVPPLGIAYLNAILNQAGIDSTCVDGFGEGVDNFRPIENTNLVVNGLQNHEVIQRIHPESKLIGISCMFSSEWINTSQLIKKIKHALPHSFIVLGGEHVTADCDYILKHYPEVDACILGEGEAKMLQLAQCLKEGITQKKEIPGIRYLDSHKNIILENDFEFRVKDINSLPAPNWGGVPLNEYHKRGLGMSMIGKITMPMILSRGCPYRCTFCSSEKMWTTRWVARDIDNIVAEIKTYKEAYGINHLDFFDLTAIVNKSWTKDFCRKLIEADLNVTWSLPSGTRSEALDREVLSLLKRSGCTKLTYAPETGSNRINKLIKKRVNLNKMLWSMREAVKLGIIVKANIIFGFPDENWGDRLKNYVFIIKMALIGIHDIPVFGFTPYPGSELFDRLEKEGQIKRDENYYIFLANLVYTRPTDRKSWNKDLSHRQISQLSLSAMGIFYGIQFLTRPWRFFRLIKNVATDKTQTMLEVALANMIKDFWHGKRKGGPQGQVDPKSVAT